MRNNLFLLIFIWLLVDACTKSSQESLQKISSSYIFNSNQDTIVVSFLLDSIYQPAPLGMKGWNDSHFGWSFATSIDTIDIFFYRLKGNENISFDLVDIGMYHKIKAELLIPDAKTDPAKWLHTDDIDGVYTKSMSKYKTIIFLRSLSKNKLGGYEVEYHARTDSFDLNNFKKIIKTIRTEYKTAKTLK